MELVNRELAIDPGHPTVFAVLAHHLIHCFVKAFAERTFRVGIFHKYYRRVGVAENMVLVAYWSKLYFLFGNGSSIFV